MITPEQVIDERDVFVAPSMHVAQEFEAWLPAETQPYVPCIGSRKEARVPTRTTRTTLPSSWPVSRGTQIGGLAELRSTGSGRR